MVELDNSARKLFRATYSPIAAQPNRPVVGRAWAKHSLVAGLQITPDEFKRLAIKAEIDADTLHALEAVVHAKSAAAPLENVPLFAGVPLASLAKAGELLARERQKDLEAFRELQREILVASQDDRIAPSEVHPSLQLRGATSEVPESSRMGSNLVPSTFTLRSTLSWAIEHGIRVADAAAFLARLSRDASTAKITTAKDYETALSERADRTWNIVAAIKLETQSKLEPVGLLHLERLNFVPVGIERGELVGSVPLSPSEEVNIAHKEWSTTSEEFSRIVTDFLEGYSEEGVTEKAELAQSTTSQDQHSSGFNTGVTASGGYGPVSITTSLAVGVADSASRSESVARNHSNTMTRKASARSRKEHKVTFKVASAAGTEDQQIRRIKNPFSDKATRVDYYQLVRKWRVDLYRYGLRLTYDVMIPEPGIGILSKIQEAQDITEALQQGFEFDLKPSALTRNNFDKWAAEYNAVVPAPPAEFKWYDLAGTHHWNSFEESKKGNYYTLEVDIPEDYVVDDAHTDKAGIHGWADHEDHPPIVNLQSVNDFKGKSGRQVLVYYGAFFSSIYVELHVRAALRESAYTEWKLKVWNAIREAAQARYDENRQNLKQRLSALLEELGTQDPLSLRKIEREEVMKGVLRWMLGPGFDFSPSIAEVFFRLADKATLYKQYSYVIGYAMSLVAAQGEIIKFLHHAIEWENMLYFLYPYFWSHSSRWELKKYLNHPDPMHRVFLKSGSARVVLTIRPGFEKDFVSLLETGQLGNDHPYVRIAEEMEAYAKTNYPGIRAANPVEDARPLLTQKQRKAWDAMQAIMGILEQYKEQEGAYPTTDQGLSALAPFGDIPAADPWGTSYSYTSPGALTDYDLVSYGADAEPGGSDEDADITSWAEASLIGRWYEYTPTSALDIAFDESVPTA